jgi:hypothetical protein
MLGFNRNVAQGMAGGGFGAGPFGPGSPLATLLASVLNPANAVSGDAVYTEEALQRVMNQLMEQNTGSNAPPPASEAAINALPKTKVDEKMLGETGEGECSVCMDSVALGDEVVKLPCTHWFHEVCVTAWLKEHNTCPICRKGLPNPEGENPQPRPGGSGNSNGPAPRGFPGSGPNWPRFFGGSSGNSGSDTNSRSSPYTSTYNNNLSSELSGSAPPLFHTTFHQIPIPGGTLNIIRASRAPPQPVSRESTPAITRRSQSAAHRRSASPTMNHTSSSEREQRTSSRRMNPRRRESELETETGRPRRRASNDSPDSVAEGSRRAAYNDRTRPERTLYESRSPQPSESENLPRRSPRNETSPEPTSSTGFGSGIKNSIRSLFNRPH